MFLGFSISSVLSLEDIYFLRDQVPLKVYTLYGFYGFINMNETMPLENDKENG